MTERGEATRQRLLDAAAAVFSERGYARATTKEIARAAAVSEGTIYRHFADKKELFGAAFIGRNASNAVAITGLPNLAGTKSVRENLQFLMRAIEDIEANVAPLQAAMSSDAELARSLFSEAPQGEGGAPRITPLQPLAAYLAAEQKLGRVRADVDAADAAFALFAIPFTAVTSRRLARAAGLTAEVDMMGALDVVLRGLEPSQA
ncbi:MAG: TetR/AcrR family transcriptional regulator [Actinobacteria bacterium]|nr:TetR/AcrR family transcriptional regulator [Actinomycetota bacterium]MCG2806862.1 TetR/AcrR family transcriptional regulator [Coriobacteriia bacterium]